MSNSQSHSAMSGPETSWFSGGRFALLIAGFLVASFPQVVFGSQTFFFRDYILFGYPLAYYHRECFWQGELPLWNPLNDCGLPYLAQWNTITLYPGTLVYLLFPLEWSLAVYCLLHLLWAALGMYWLVRFWTQNPTAAAIAGTAFAFNGLALNCLMWPNNVATYAWMPWMLYFAVRAWREGGRRVLLAAVAGAMQMLAGTPEIILLTWGVIGAVWLLEIVQSSACRRRYVIRFAILCALISGLAAVQLLPFAELLRHSHRDASYSDDSWAMPPWGWANLLAPQFYLWRWNFGVLFQPSQGWTSSYYPGIAILTLGLFAGWRVRQAHARLFAGLIMLSLILALGPAGHLYSWIKQILPQIGIVRFPVKLVVPAILLTPLLGGLGWAWLTSLPAGDWQRERYRLCLLAIILGLLMVVLVGFAQVFPYGNSAVILSAFSRAGIMGVMVVGIIFWQKLPGPVARAAIGLTLILLIWLDALTHVPNQNPTVEPWVYEPGLTRADNTLQAGQARLMSRHDTEYSRYGAVMSDATHDVLSKRMGAYANCNLLDRVPKLTGAFSLHSHEMFTLLDVLYQQPDFLPDGLGDFLGVAAKPQPGKGFDFVPRQHYLPMVTAGQQPVFADPPATLTAITSAKFNPRAQVFLPRDAQVTNVLSPNARAQLKSYAAHRMEIASQAESPALVVIAQSYYPAWRARVDDVPVKIWRANYAFQALEVPAGTHQIVLTYVDQGFRLGAVISLVTWLGCVLGLFLPKNSLSRLWWRQRGVPHRV